MMGHGWCSHGMRRVLHEQHVLCGVEEKGQSSAAPQRVSLLSLRLCEGNQQVSIPPVTSLPGNCFILPVPECSSCLSGSAASMCLLWLLAATGSALRKS